MKKIIILLGFLISFDSMGACLYPNKNFNIPPGWNTSEREMVTSQQNVKDYQKDLGRYRDCLDDELGRIRSYVGQDSKTYSDADDLMTMKFNASVDDERKLAEEWGCAVENFKTNRRNNCFSRQWQPSNPNPRSVEAKKAKEDEERKRAAEARKAKEDEERRRAAEARKAKEDEERRRVAEKAAKENQLIEISSGTGFFINNQGYFVSNNHVVEICSEVKTKKEGQTYTANIIAVDKKNDLALGKVNFSDNDYISMSDDGARLGEEVIVAGFPFQQQLSESIKITKGIISSLSGPGNDYSVFQMDAAVQPGNSGGPIINNQGKLIGVTVAKANSEAFYEETGSLPENINFGIKVETIKPFLSANKIKQPWSFFSSSTLMNGVELADKASETTIHLQCWNTIASVRKLVKDNKVRNLLINID